jgi:hypothetical protein
LSWAKAQHAKHTAITILSHCFFILVFPQFRDLTLGHLFP